MTEELNFCSRCGKRIRGSIDHVHTCTTPKNAGELSDVYTHGFADGQRSAYWRNTSDKLEWVGLTLEDIQDLNASKDWIAGAKWAATLLWEKNNAKT